MGSNDESLHDTAPWHEVTVEGFWIDRTEVTNEQFYEFVQTTGYVTSAEKPLNPEYFPGVSQERLVPSGFVFTTPLSEVALDNPHRWWRLLPGADWRHPEGPNSDIRGRMNHPVVQVSLDDAVAYAAWAGKRLPTEAEWELAARGGLDRNRFPWGNELRPGGRWMANIWQGDFPVKNSISDGFSGTAPVGSFPANGFGLFDMAGNVWEWCADWYDARMQRDYGRGLDVRSTASHGVNIQEQPMRVQRGGSFLCWEGYCRRFDAGGRGKGVPGVSTSHVGFRCAATYK